MPFEWHPDEPPPEIEAHSRAKLDVLRSYLRAYFDKLNNRFNRDEFKLDLVDGFAGGGSFLDQGVIHAGTPLIMLEESEAAQERLNRNRTKPLRIDCKFYFVDKKAHHTDHLQKVLTHHGHDALGDRVIVRNSLFKDEIDGILHSIRERQPRAGRAIFLLDQTGYSQVELSLIARIFRQLPGAEVILTFAADALIKFLRNDLQMMKATAPLQFSESLIQSLLQRRDGSGGRALVQRVLREHLRRETGATFDTPFFIRPEHSRRALWFLHLSRHHIARDVMIQCHWQLQNTFEHYGRGDLSMLGWDALKDSTTLPLFNFNELDAQEMRTHLLESLPREMFALASEGPVSVETIHHALANQTAARFSDLDEVILQLAKEREFDILNAQGKMRSRQSRKLDPQDRVSLPSIRIFPEWSRRA